MSQVKFELRSSGYCSSDQHHVLRGSDKKTIKFYATWAYINHPVHGHILFDTGYTQRFFQYTKKFPACIYRRTTPTFIKPEEEAHFQLNKIGIAPEEVNYIIISHFHADHICGLCDFPNATFIAERSSYLDIKGKSGVAAVRRAFLPQLLPNDFEQRLKLIDVKEGKKKDEHLGAMVDLFNDGSILLCDFTGHAKGQIGALLNTTTGPILLAADAAWVKDNYQKLHLPTPLVRLFFDSWSDFKRNLKKLHAYHLNNPDVIIIPCHCLETYDKYKATKA